MKSFFVSSLLVSVDAFSVFKSTSVIRNQFSSQTTLFSTDPSSTSSSSDNKDIFGSPTPVIATTTDGDLDIDFDALAKESAGEAFNSKGGISDIISREKKTQVRVAPRQAQWFPMLLSPTPLDGSFAGDVGFDPLGFASDTPTLIRMREAEIKHSRLAMLAVAGWPLSELWHNSLAKDFGLESLLATENRAPSILNGGLINEWIIGTGVATIALSATLEYITYQASQKAGYKPGNLNFDPLGLHTFRTSFGLDQVGVNLSREEKLARARYDMELSEIKHGRLAMIAITGMAAAEAVSGISVVEQTPFFFGDPMF